MISNNSSHRILFFPFLCSYSQRLKARPAKLAHQICNRIQNFGPFLKRICIERTDLYLAVNQGLAEGIKTCQKVFENERWNCTPKGDPLRAGLLGFVMARGILLSIY